MALLALAWPDGRICEEPAGGLRARKRPEERGGAPVVRIRTDRARRAPRPFVLRRASVRAARGFGRTARSIFGSCVLSHTLFEP